MGLALSKGLGEAMDGTIEAASTPVVGSTLVVEFAGAHSPRGEREPTPMRAPGPAVLAGSDRRPKVLYIEDNLSNVRLAERVLERHATVELITTMQGSMGLTLARDHHPRLIILDLHLPDIPGEEVLQDSKPSRRPGTSPWRQRLNHDSVGALEPRLGGPRSGQLAHLNAGPVGLAKPSCNMRAKPTELAAGATAPAGTATPGPAPELAQSEQARTGVSFRPRHGDGIMSIGPANQQVLDKRLWSLAR